MNCKSAKAIAGLIVGTLAMVGVLLIVTGAWAAPDQSRVSAPLAPADIVSGTLSYQGRLLSGDSPVNGTRVMTFSVYAQSSGGVAVWSQMIDVVVNKGLFSVYLQVDPVLFNGQALWLGVTVAGESEMTPRQPLLPAPYALSLRPGAVVSASSISPVLSVINQGNGTALWSSNNTTYAALTGENQGNGPGVMGDSDTGTGVAGNSVNGYGVYGQSLTGAGGYFTSTNGAGVWANSLKGHALVTNRPSLIAGPNSKQVALLRWYPAIATTTTFSVGTHPAGVAFDGANIWVANFASDNVSVLRANDGSHVMTPTVGSTPFGLAYDGANMWVTNLGDGALSVLRASDGNRVMTPTVGNYPAGVAFDGINMWVGNSGDNSVSVLRASDGAHVITAAVGSYPKSIAFDGTNMWVVNSNSHNVSVLHLDPGPHMTYVMTPTVGGTPWGIAFDGANMWVANTVSSTVSVLRASDGATLATIPVGNMPSDIAFDGANMWVTNVTGNTVTIIRAADFAVVGVVPVGNYPNGIAFDGANMWVTNQSPEYRIYLPVVMRS
jgi:YVTN family beta-propeller protein